MNIANLRNSILDTIDNIDSFGVHRSVENLLMVFLSEMWTHTASDYVEYDSLTDVEFRLLGEWVHINRNSYEGKKITMIRDMREVFPGLSLMAAVYFVRGR